MASSLNQIPLPFPVRASLAADDFIVADHNQDAISWLEKPETWPGVGLIVIGPRGSGKTHLTKVWQHQTKAVLLEPNKPYDFSEHDHVHFVIDDLDHWIKDKNTEEQLVHLHNHILSNQGRVLITSSTPLQDMTFVLKDSESRLKSYNQTTIALPNTDFIEVFLAKQFADRQLNVKPDVLSYIATRIDRNFASALTIVDQLDHAALANQRQVTKALAKNIIETPEG